MQPSVPKSVTVPGIGTLAFDGTNYTCTLAPTGQPVDQSSTTSSKTVNVESATNAAPIVLTTDQPLFVGIPGGVSTMLTVVGVLGNLAANGSWKYLANGNAITLIGSDGTSSGAYTSGGTVGVSYPSAAASAAAALGILSTNPITVRGPTLGVAMQATTIWQSQTMGFVVPAYRPSAASERAGALINAFFGRGAVGPSS